MYKYSLVSVLFFLFSCANSDSLIDLFGSKSFWSFNIENGQITTSYQFPAVFLAESNNAMVYVSYDTSFVTKSLAKDVLNEFEKTGPILESTFGKRPDVDKNGKVILLFLDIRDGAKQGDPYIAGYFSPYDQYSDKSVKKSLCAGSICIRSNEADILYLDTYPAIPGSRDFLATMAHEYQHMLHFEHDYEYYLQNTSAKFEETWVNEGLSEVASDIAGYGPQTSRLNYYSSTATDSLIGWNSSLADYSNVYVYFRFIADSVGNSVISAIFRDNDVGIAGVENAFANTNTFVSGCGSNFPHAYTRFECSFRLEQAAIYGLTNVSGNVAGTAFSFTRSAQYKFNLAPAVPPASSISGSLTLSGYAAKAVNVTSSISTSSPFTGLWEGSNGVVYSHDTNTSNSTANVTTNVIGRLCGSSLMPRVDFPTLGAKLN
ncbi:MAG: hypothetical protein D6767_02655 [Candidatus Hydrogenedentota bacterium]|nr:MAG: hypothetical protein D6767_02655 [Candidatus Hydrogenedentota bacterium]